MECPFRLCTAWVTPVIEQARPDDDELTVQRIPIHEIEGQPGYSFACPASLIATPLNTDATELLEEQAVSIENMVAEQARRGETSSGPAHGPEAPRPRRPGESDWFASHTGDNPKGEFIPGLPVVRPLPGQGVQPAEIVQPVNLFGGQSNVSEDHATMANGLLEMAKQKIGELQTSISILTDQLETAAASAGTFQERGEQVVAYVMQAAEGSRTHNHRIQDAMGAVHQATNEDTHAIISTVHQAREALDGVFRKLGAAYEDLNNAVF